MYKIDRTNLKKERNFKIKFALTGLMFFGVITFFIILDMLSGKSNGNPITGLFLIFLTCAPLIWVGRDGVKKYKEKMAKYDYLEQHGKLERGLKYSLQRSGMAVMGRPIMKIVVDYKLTSGSIVQLSGDGRFDHRIADWDGLVDLLIDPYDPTNYYLDFHIGENY